MTAAPESRGALAVMARAPSTPGKTRLAPHVSPSRLADLRAALLADTLTALAGVRSLSRFIFFTPEGAEPEMAELSGTGWQLRPQRDGDLGRRIAGVFDELLVVGGWPQAIVVGSDVPWLSDRHVIDARTLLDAHGGMVLGPADDGGYYLIGMQTVHANLFSGIEWGTASVLTDTLRQAERSGVEARLIGGAYDIDTIEDLRRAERELRAADERVAPHLRAWLQRA